MNETEWKVVHLEYVCEKKGLVRGPFGGALKKEFFVQSGYKVYEQKNAIQKDERIGEYFIDEEKFQELKRFEVNGGDFIISCSGTIGRIFRIPNNAPKGVINQALLKIRLDNRKINSEFFYQYFQWDTFQRRIIDNTQGGAMPNLVGMNIFRRTPIPLPTMNEQQKIASILSTWDKAIELKEKLIEQKKEQKKGLMQKLLTGEVRLPGFDGEWESVPVEKLCSLIMGKTPSRKNDDYWGSGYKWISIADLKSKYILQTSEEITEKALKETKIKAIPKGTVIMSFKLTIGRVGITGEDMYSNEAIVSLRNKDKKILDDEYLYYYLSSIDVTKFGSIAAKGVTLNSDSLKEIIIKLPTISEQVAIREIMSKLDLNIELLEKELSLLKEQKNGLMQLLLTGKVRVKV